MLESCDVYDFGAPPTLAEAMPQLESPTCFGDGFGGLAGAALGHPVLRKVSVDMSDSLDDDDNGDAQDWWRAVSSLPQLADLSFAFKATSFCEVADQGAAGARERLAIMAGCLQECPLVARLRIFTDFQLPAHRVLAKLGAAAGANLRTLKLASAVLPASPTEAARAFDALPLHFPRLAELSLAVAVPDETEDRGAGAAAAALAMLRPLDALLPRCPALSAVTVTPVVTSPCGRSHFKCVAECCEALRPPTPARL